MQKYKKALTFLELLIVFFSIFILTMISVPEYPRRHPREYKKACYSNMRVLMGAVEMYNMDVADMTSILDQDQLYKGKYIKQLMVCPEPNKGATYSGTNLDDGSGEIICSYHGGLETEGEYDRKYR